MPLKSNISKKDMAEEDIKNRFVTPALNQAGWESGLILMEKYFTAGRILVPTKGKRHAKKDGNKADYILFAEPNLPIAIVEAKDNNQPVSGGIQQAIRYAEILDLPFAFSSNGDGFFEFDRTTGNQRPDITLDGFQTPAELHRRYWDSRRLNPAERAVVDVRMQEVGGSELAAYYLDFSGNRRRPLQHTPQVVVKTGFYAFLA